MDKKYKLTSSKGNIIYLDSNKVNYTIDWDNGDHVYGEVDITDMSQDDIDVLLDQFKKVSNGRKA